MKKIYLCTPHKLGQLNHELISRISACGFDVLCAVTHTPQDVPLSERFQRNVDLLKASDIFVAVLNNYGKDLTAEVGMAYAWDKPRIGIDYNAQQSDAMCYYALQRIILPGELEQTLAEFK